MCDDMQTQSYTWDGNVAFADGNVYLQDELGSPLRFIDGMGATIDSYGYDEFGADLYGNQGTAQPFGYTGYAMDSVAGTYFAQAREYVPTIGRFSGVDIVKGCIRTPMTLNEYVYCWGNPLGFVDLNGMEPESLEELEYWRAAVERGNEAHREFSVIMSTIPGADMKYTILTGLQKEYNLGYSTPTGRGYPDLVHFQGNTIEVYELKPFTPFAIELGRRQVNAYARAIQMNTGMYVQLGTSLAPQINSLPPVPSKIVPGSQIRYFTKSTMPGLVFYQYTIPPPPIPAKVPDLSKESQALPENWQNVQTLAMPPSLLEVLLDVCNSCEPEGLIGFVLLAVALLGTMKGQPQAAASGFMFDGSMSSDDCTCGGNHGGNSNTIFKGKARGKFVGDGYAGGWSKSN
jgi:RHS repeat-associated protein